MPIRQIGGNLNTGSTGPHQTVLTLREPGSYRLQVTYSDGEQQEQIVNLAADGPRHQTIRLK